MRISGCGSALTPPTLLTDRPVCVCHGEPCYWNADKRKTKGGWWECAVRRRAMSRRRYAAVAAAKLARQRDQYRREGWLTKRRRDLAGQRARLEERLTQLEQEANALVSEP